MKLIECTNAYAAVLALERQDMDSKTAYALVKLKRKLQSDAEFFLKEENELIKKFADKDEDGKIIWETPLRVQILDPKRKEEYINARKELYEIEVQEELTPWHAPMPRSIQPIQLEALEGFIVFDGEGGKK